MFNCSKLLLSLFVYFTFGIILIAQELNHEIILSGIYQGDNLFIQNPFSGTPNQFCIEEVLVNDRQVVSNPRVSALEIKLTQFAVDQPLTVRIVHRPNCEPFILNPQIVVFAREFQFLSINVNEDSISWTTTGETGKGDMVMQRLASNGWEDLLHISSKGSFDANQYQAAAEHVIGVNKYRITLITENGEELNSNESEFMYQQQITFSPVRVSDKITLSEEAFYEVYDLEGNQITKGTGVEIMVQGLSSGKYFLYINQREEVFFKE